VRLNDKQICDEFEFEKSSHSFSPLSLAVVASFPSAARSGRDDERLRFLAGELSPLLDRLGRALTDIAPHLRTFSDSPASRRAGEEEESKEAVPSGDQQPPALDPFSGLWSRMEDGGRAAAASGAAAGGSATEPARQQSSGLDALEALTSMLRSRRAPSPPPGMAFRQNISTSSSRALEGGATAASGHVDIHIHAILSPLSRLAGLASGLQVMRSFPLKLFFLDILS
jgi:hypothetical protein